MLVLDKFGFEAIGRFIEAQEIDIASLGSIVQVDGENLNTGGSSGAAKSTIFHAMDYLFGLNHIPNLKLQSRLTKNGIRVWATGTYNGLPIKISRSKKDGLVIEGAGMDSSGNSKLAEEKLDQIIAMPRELFHKIYHKRQNKGGFFMNLGPKDTNDFLMNCLNLNHLKTKAELIDKHLKTFVGSKEESENILALHRRSLLATQESILAIGLAPMRDIHPDTVEQLKATLNKSEVNLTRVLTAHKAARDELQKEKPEISTTPFNRSEIEKYEKELQGIRKAMDQAQQAERERYNAASRDISAMKLTKAGLENQAVTGKTLQKDAANIAAQIKKIRESICPTCSQGWATDTAVAHEAKLLEQLKTIKPQIELGKKAELELVDLTQKINDKLPDLIAREVNLTAEKQQEQSITAFLADQRLKEMEHNRAENSRISALSGGFATKMKELQDSQAKEAEMARGQVDVDRRTYDAANYKLHAFETANVKYEQTLFTFKNNEASYQKKVEEFDAKVASLTKKVGMMEEAKRALKIFISCAFDEALETISAEATRVIRCIPNMATATVQLEGQRETKEGKVKEEVTAVIHADGEENIPLETFSGGERSALDLAIDLAVIDLIESKTGKGINFFILDEPFTGLGATEIEMALEVLKNSNTNKKLFIVDHNPVVKESIPNRILVVREGLVSKIAA